jgi:hypothetical protein
MLLKKLILGAGLLGTVGVATPALADCPPPAAGVTYEAPVVTYGAPVYTPVYYGAGYRYGYGRRYWAPPVRRGWGWHREGWGRRGWGYGRRW